MYKFLLINTSTCSKELGLLSQTLWLRPKANSMRMFISTSHSKQSKHWNALTNRRLCIGPSRSMLSSTTWRRMKLSSAGWISPRCSSPKNRAARASKVSSISWHPRLLRLKIPTHVKLIYGPWEYLWSSYLRVRILTTFKRATLTRLNRVSFMVSCRRCLMWCGGRSGFAISYPSVWCVIPKGGPQHVSYLLISGSLKQRRTRTSASTHLRSGPKPKNWLSLIWRSNKQKKRKSS